MPRERERDATQQMTVAEDIALGAQGVARAQGERDANLGGEISAQVIVVDRRYA